MDVQNYGATHARGPAPGDPPVGPLYGRGVRARRDCFIRSPNFGSFAMTGFPKEKAGPTDVPRLVRTIEKGAFPLFVIASRITDFNP